MKTRVDWLKAGFTDHLSALGTLNGLVKEIDPRLVFIPAGTKTRYYAVIGIGRDPFVEKPESDDQPVRLEPKGSHATKDRKYFKVSARVRNTLVWVEKAKNAGFKILPSDMHPQNVRFRPLKFDDMSRHRKFLKDLLRASYKRWVADRRDQEAK